MKKNIFVLLVIVLMSACSIAPKGKAVRAVADENRFESLNQQSALSISIPSPHSGVYASVDQLNFQIDLGTNKERNASAIVGKARGTGDWEVITVLVNENGKWTTLDKKSP